MRRVLRSISLIVAAAVPASTIAAQQSSLAISPFVSFLPSAGASPLAGLALTLGGSSGFALRGSANIATSTTSGAYGNTVRPWGADADAMLLIGNRRGYSQQRSITPFVFAGLGTQTRDDGFGTQTTHNWSYGFGAAVPVATTVDLFGEGRWRMAQYVLPTARDAASPTTELRFGVSFHLGSGGSNDSPRRRGRRLSF